MDKIWFQEAGFRLERSAADRERQAWRHDFWQGLTREIIQLNEDSVWYGGPKEPIIRMLFGTWTQIRRWILEGRSERSPSSCCDEPFWSAGGSCAIICRLAI